MASDSNEAARRRKGRGTWPIRAYDLGGEPPDDLSHLTTPTERVRMMKELAESVWRLAGRPVPSYRRHEMPGRLFNKGEARPDDDDV